MKKCKYCKGKGKLYPSNDYPTCRVCKGTGISKGKNSIDKTIEKILNYKPKRKYTEKQLLEKLWKITKC